jgi:hypothetical protein
MAGTDRLPPDTIALLRRLRDRARAHAAAAAAAPPATPSGPSTVERSSRLGLAPSHEAFMAGEVGRLRL